MRVGLSGQHTLHPIIEGVVGLQATAGPGETVSASDGGSDASAAAPEAERGRPVWSEARNRTPEEGAQRSFERNGADFGAATVDAYIQQAHAFIADPPAGTETVQRRNGDTLYYQAATNTFAVVDRNGVPRTMFKPDDGPTYWAQQKERAPTFGQRRQSTTDAG